MPELTFKYILQAKKSEYIDIFQPGACSYICCIGLIHTIVTILCYYSYHNLECVLFVLPAIYCVVFIAWLLIADLVLQIACLKVSVC